MLQIMLPDGTKRNVKKGTTLAEIGKDYASRYDSPLAAGTRISLDLFSGDHET